MDILGKPYHILMWIEVILKALFFLLILIVRIPLILIRKRYSIISFRQELRRLQLSPEVMETLSSGYKKSISLRNFIKN